MLSCQIARFIGVKGTVLLQGYLSLGPFLMRWKLKEYTQYCGLPTNSPWRLNLGKAGRSSKVFRIPNPKMARRVAGNGNNIACL